MYLGLQGIRLVYWQALSQCRAILPQQAMDTAAGADGSRDRQHMGSEPGENTMRPRRRGLLAGQRSCGCESAETTRAAGHVLVGGYGLYVREGKPTFVYNYLALERFTFTGREPLPKGKVQLTVDFAYKGGAGERGKGAAVAMLVNGTKVAAGDMPRTIPLQISLGEGLDLGMDGGSAVDFTYKLPFTFTGTIDKVMIELK